MGARLDGWKTIATYLDKAERTVKRWESTRGLPIHRLPGGGRAAVYAIAAELDGWLESNRSIEQDFPDNSTPTEADQRFAEGEIVAGVDLETKPRGKSSGFFSFLLKQKLMLTALGVLLVVVAAEAVRLVETRNGPLGLFGRNAAAKPSPNSVANLAISDADKALAREMYLKGRFEWNKRTPESLNRALDYFTQSIVHDPDNARTYAGLADTYILLHEYSLMPDREAETRALAAAAKAVELNGSLAEAHRSLAFAEVWGNWDFRAGEREFRRAIQLDPQDPLTHLWFATAFNTPEWSRVAANEFERAQELDPTSAVILSNKSIWLFENGHRQAGIDLAHQVERDDPDFVAPHRYLARMYWDMHDYSAYLAETAKTANFTHDQVLNDTIVKAQAAFRRDGERGMLNALYRIKKKQYEEGNSAGTPVAEVCIRLGLKDEAVQLIQHDFDQHRAELLWILSEPEFEVLKSERGYLELTKKLNFPSPPVMSQ